MSASKVNVRLRRAFEGRASRWKATNPDPNYLGLAVSEGMARRRTSKLPQACDSAKSAGLTQVSGVDS